MQITFNPLQYDEQQAVYKMLVAMGVGGPAMPVTTSAGKINQIIAPADRPDAGTDAELVTISESAGFAESAIPLPPGAPLPAAADMFGTAPVAQPVGIPAPPTATSAPVPAAPPTPPAVPPAPAAPASHAPGADLDKDGLPWNAEIHSGERGKNKDGTWRKKRNLDPTVLARVTAELRALMAIPTPGAQSAAPLSPGVAAVTPVGTAPVSDPSNPLATTSPALSATDPASIPIPTPPVGDAGNVPPASPTSPPATAPIPTPPAATDATSATSSAPATFAGVMRKVTEGLREHKFTEARVNELLASIGVVKIGHLAARPDLLAAFDALLEAE